MGLFGTKPVVVVEFKRGMSVVSHVSGDKAGSESGDKAGSESGE